MTTPCFIRRNSTSKFMCAQMENGVKNLKIKNIIFGSEKASPTFFGFPYVRGSFLKPCKEANNNNGIRRTNSMIELEDFFFRRKAVEIQSSSKAVIRNGFRILSYEKSLWQKKQSPSFFLKPEAKKSSVNISSGSERKYNTDQIKLNKSQKNLKLFLNLPKGLTSNKPHLASGSVLAHEKKVLSIGSNCSSSDIKWQANQNDDTRNSEITVFQEMTSVNSAKSLEGERGKKALLRSRLLCGGIKVPCKIKLEELISPIRLSNETMKGNKKCNKSDINLNITRKTSPIPRKLNNNNEIQLDLSSPRPWSEDSSCSSEQF